MNLMESSHICAHYMKWELPFIILKSVVILMSMKIILVVPMAIIEEDDDDNDDDDDMDDRWYDEEEYGQDLQKRIEESLLRIKIFHPYDL
ncbi:hypothetical protein REPUB_Repub08aG0194600 [Reevesia pubescens]